MGFKKWVISELNKQVAGELAEECNIEPFLALMAYGRGYCDPFALDEFLSRDIPDIDPYIFPDMEKAVERVNLAVSNNEKILVYGDYDCDGVTSTALVYSFLRSLGADVSYHIPSRMGEGYGMNCDSVKAIAESGVKFIITVDNGISAIDEIALANELSVDVVVTDHHLPKEQLPDAVAVVDPHRADSMMEFKDFAGVGVAFALCLAISGTSPEVMLAKYADLVALGTVADVMPLKYENRSMVWVGLRKINNNPSIGIKALIAASGGKFGEINTGSLAFTVAPRINAAGRLGDAGRAVELLIAENYAAAMEIAASLDDENVRRQKIEQSIADAAAKTVLNYKLFNNRVIVVAGEGWHEGVLGIAAARIAETYARPVILLSREKNEDFYKGSARTVGDFSIFDAIKSCSDLLIKFGGHDKAAGLTVGADKLEKFITRINEYANGVDFPVPVLHIDCRLNPAAVVPDLVRTLDALEPYGTENPRPVFGLLGMTVKNILPTQNGKHIRIIAAKNNTTVAMLMFGMSRESFPFTEGDVLDFAISLDIKEYQGQEQLSVFVKDVRVSGKQDDEIISQILLYEAFVKDNLNHSQANMLLFDRNELATLYKAIKGGCDSPIKLERNLKEFGTAKVMVMLDVMEEMGLITLNGADDYKKITILPSGKVDLENSTILKNLKSKAVKL